MAARLMTYMLSSHLLNYNEFSSAYKKTSNPIINGADIAYLTRP
jgi:hypothetical protein